MVARSSFSRCGGETVAQVAHSVACRLSNGAEGKTHQRSPPKSPFSTALRAPALFGTAARRMTSRTAAAIGLIIMLVAECLLLERAPSSKS